MLGHRKIGDGPEAVIVGHEWLGDHANWEPALPYLSADAFTWVVADLRGYGWSRDLPGAYTVEEAAADLLALADHYGLSRFHLVGHSMSGMVVQYLAMTAAERVKSVVAVAPVPASGFKTDAAGRARLAAVIDDDEAALDAFRARGGTRYGPAWLRAKLTITRAAATREAMEGYLRMFTTTDFAAAIEGLTTPLTVICGAHDLPLYREESMRRLFAPLYPNLDILVDREAGHYPMLETPPLLAGLIETGLRRGV